MFSACLSSSTSSPTTTFQTHKMTETITINPNINKKIISEGVRGRTPSLNWTCEVVLGTDDKTESVEITLGHGSSKKDRLIERCVESMYLGEQSLFRLKPDAETTTEVCITLKSFKEKPYIFQWSDDEKLEASNFYKLKGAQLFKENEIEEAFYKFSTALKLILMLDSVLEEDDPPVDINNLQVALYNNLASCHLYFRNYSSVVKLCTSSIIISPTSKALYRRAVASIELKEYEKAENDLRDLLKLEPKNTAALDKYKIVRELDKGNRENYKSIMKKMFS